MSDVLSQPMYPASEGIDEIIDLKGRLEEEMRMYPTEEDLRQNLKGLDRLHGQSPFGLMIHHFAHLAGLEYASFVNEPQKALVWEDMFTAGGLFGLHVATSSLPDGLSGKLHSSYDPEIDNLVSNEGMGASHGVLHNLGILEEVNTEGFDPDDNEVLVKMASLYSPESTESERYFFALGYRFAVVEAAEMSEYFTEYDHLTESYEKDEEMQQEEILA
jgi:hypothetical protein